MFILNFLNFLFFSRSFMKHCSVLCCASVVQYFPLRLHLVIKDDLPRQATEEKVSYKSRP